MKWVIVYFLLVALSVATFACPPRQQCSEERQDCGYGQICWKNCCHSGYPPEKSSVKECHRQDVCYEQWECPRGFVCYQNCCRTGYPPNDYLKESKLCHSKNACKEQSDCGLDRLCYHNCCIVTPSNAILEKCHPKDVCKEKADCGLGRTCLFNCCKATGYVILPTPSP